MRTWMSGKGPPSVWNHFDFIGPLQTKKLSKRQITYERRLIELKNVLINCKLSLKDYLFAVANEIKWTVDTSFMAQIMRIKF